MTGPVPEKTAVIYAAANMQEAHLLKDALTEAGIRATVINDLLQGGSGVDVWGLPTTVTVAVPEEDALRAREMALEFERQVAEMRRQGSLAEQKSPGQRGPAEKPREPAPWPTCPRCGRRRTTRCPVCGTVGSDFPAADPDFSGVLGLEGADASPACSCGSGGCTPAGPVDQDEPVIVAEESPLEPPRTMLLCPTCDEPFVPEYPRRCEWCGEQFQSGFEVAPTAEPGAYEPGFDARLLVVVAMILVLLAALGGWLMYVFG
jgi:rubrerythrin